MTTKEYSKRLLKFADKLDKSKPFFDAVANSVEAMADRVFIRGEFNPEPYSTNPLYVNPLFAPRKFGVKGKPYNSKPGRTKFANGEPHKTRYFENYTQYKLAIKQKSFVNLVLFGNLQRAFRVGIAKKDNKIVHKIAINESNPEGKIKGLMKKYPQAFKLTKEEKNAYKEDLRNYLDDYLEKQLNK